MARFLLIGLFVFSSPLWGLPFDYAQMQLKDLDEISQMIDKRIAIAKAKNSLSPLESALLVLMSRPDEDGAIGKIWPRLHGELNSRKAYKRVVTSAVKKSLRRAADDSQKVSMQATYFTVLFNMISQFGAFASYDPVAKDMLERIRDAQVPVSAKIQRERKMRVMKKTVSPSDVAAAKLNELFPPKKDDD